jgi:hypothetical protein
VIGAKSEIPDLIELLDLSSLHVHAPTAAVFLCGGQTDLTSALPVSLRDAFARIIFNPPFNKYRVVFAEEAELYGPDRAYHNWLEFEVDAAQVSQLILLFCEGSGSVSELGSFVVIDEIARRLLVIVESIYYLEGSYISLGSFKELVNKYGEDSLFVLYYDGLTPGGVRDASKVDLNELGSRLAAVIPKAIERHREPRTFDPSRNGHVIKLITGFVQHYGALTILEIDVILFSLGLKVTEEQILKYLKCAIFFSWIIEQKRGSDVFFVASVARDAIEYSLVSNAGKIDKLRWRANIIAYWKANEPERFRSITAALAGTA